MDVYDEPDIEDVVAEALRVRGIGARACGLNADWCLLAWCLSDGVPNTIEGGYYLLDEEETDDQDRELFVIVQRFYEQEDPQWPGNNKIDTIVGPAPLNTVLDEWVARGAK